MKLASRLASLSTGSSSSIPTSDHVPLEIYAKLRFCAGTATTADAVSCDPTATTGSPARPPMSSRTGPITLPGERTGGKICRGIPAAAISGHAQSPVRTSRSCVVEALVNSAPVCPVSQ